MTKRVADQGMPAVALTDHGSMYGVIPFYAAAKKAGIKPIIGIEAYVAPRGMTDKEGKADADYHHMILLAKDDLGTETGHELSRLAARLGRPLAPLRQSGARDRRRVAAPHLVRSPAAARRRG